MRRFVLGGLLSLALGASPSSAAVPPAAQELAALRLKVDQLAERLTEVRRQSRDELSALRAERSELRRQLRLESVRQATLTELAKSRSAKATELQGQGNTWQPRLLSMVEAARKHVQSGLPYQRDRRLDVLHRLDEDLRRTQPDYASVLSRLWRFLEEEEDLGQEIGRSQQVAKIGEEQLLVDAVHLAMAAMYIRAPDGRYGLALQDDASVWRFVWAESDEAEVISALFVAFDENRILGRQTVLLGNAPP